MEAYIRIFNYNNFPNYPYINKTPHDNKYISVQEQKQIFKDVCFKYTPIKISEEECEKIFSIINLEEYFHIPEILDKIKQFYKNKMITRGLVKLNNGDFILRYFVNQENGEMYSKAEVASILEHEFTHVLDLYFYFTLNYKQILTETEVNNLGEDERRAFNGFMCWSEFHAITLSLGEEKNVNFPVSYLKKSLQNNDYKHFVYYICRFLGKCNKCLQNKSNTKTITYIDALLTKYGLQNIYFKMEKGLSDSCIYDMKYLKQLYISLSSSTLHIEPMFKQYPTFS